MNSDVVRCKEVPFFRLVRGFIVALFGISFFAVSHESAWAAAHLASPADLLIQAQKDRSSLRNVLFELEKNIPEFSDPDEMDPYAHLLPQLQDLYDRFQLGEIYPRAVRKLGEAFFAAAQKWLDVRTTPLEKIIFYVQYANFDLAYRYAESIEFLLQREKDLALLEKGAENIEILRKEFLRLLPKELELDLKLRSTLSDLATRVLTKYALSEPQTFLWLRYFSTAQGFSTFIDKISTQILALNASNAKISHFYLGQLFLIRDRIDTFANEMPSSLAAALGDQFSELLARMTVLEVSFEAGEIEKAFDGMKAKHRRSFAQALMVRPKGPSGAYANDYLRLARLLINALNEVGLTEDAKEYSNYVQRVLAPVLVDQLGAEGNYTLRREDGTQWTFSIIQARENLIYGALGNDTQQVFKGFFNISYDIDNGGFVASYKEPDTTSTINPTAHIVILEPGAIEIEDYFALDGHRHFRGTKTSLFERPKGIPVKPGQLTGRYRGEIQYLSGERRTVELTLTLFQGYSLGRLTTFDASGAPTVFVDYQVGNKITDSVVLLTTGSLPSGTWNHLRGKIENDAFRGTMIVGGKGTVTKQFLLRKVK